jgi:curved DNA-binding protein CbpA
MRMQRNFYEVLGVSRNASKKEIKEKYYSLARKFHPDRASDKQIADKMFVQINRAYSTLYNDSKREKYDAGLDAMDAMPVARPSTPTPRPSGTTQAAPKPPVANGQQIKAWFDQASQLQLRSEFIEAISLCNKILEADPVNFSTIVLLGDLMTQTAKQPEALGVYERAARLQPTNRLLRDKMARLHSAIARRSANPAMSRPASTNGSPPPSPAQRPTPPPPAAKAESKSLFDRLIKRK